MTGLTGKRLRVGVIKITGYKRLDAVAVELDPHNNFVEITGRNNQGKSSFLEAIQVGLCGGRAIPPMPVREGYDQAQIIIDLGEIVVERIISKDRKHKLAVRTSSGAVLKADQAVLDEAFGALTFDPLQFMHMEPRHQKAQLMELVDLGFDPDEMEAQRKQLLAAKDDAEKNKTRLENTLAKMPAPSADAPEAELSTAQVLEEYQQAAGQHRQHEDAIRALAAEDARRKTLLARKAEIEYQISQLQIELESVTAQSDGLAGYIEITEYSLREAELHLPNLPALKAKLDNIEQLNQKYRETAAYDATENELADAQGAHAKAVQAIEALDVRKVKALAEAKMPVDGLSFDESGLVYNSLPLKQASSSEQLRVCVGMAMALHPQLRTILIKDGSLLDSVSKAILQQMADDQEYLLLLETVSEETVSTPGRIVIEDGTQALEAAPDMDSIDFGQGGGDEL
jgi:hypothetical protein